MNNQQLNSISAYESIHYPEISGEAEAVPEIAPPPVLKTNGLESIDYWRAHNRTHRDQIQPHDPSSEKPKTQTEWLHEAETMFEIAVENEQVHGFDDFRTVGAFENARSAFSGALWTREYVPETDDFEQLDYQDMLRYAQTLSKLSNSHILTPYKSPESFGIDRNESLFTAAITAFDTTFKIVGINAPEEVWHPIAALRVEAYAQYAKYQLETGEKKAAEKTYAEAFRELTIIEEHVTSEHLLVQVSRQKTDIRALTQEGKQPEEMRLADELVQQLAVH